MENCCALCKSEAKLANSHIVSEFLYKPIYDENHRFFAYDSSNDSFERTFQKGLREPMLCLACETRLSRFERYSSKIFLGGESILVKEHSDRIELAGLDYKKLKLFQLSLLWRMSVSSSEFFRNVSLGPYEETLRKMILSENPGPSSSFPVLYCAPYIGGQLANGFLTPDWVRTGKDRVYRALLGGILHAFYVRGKDFPETAMKYVLSEEGTLSLFRKDVARVPFLAEAFVRVAEANPLSFGQGRE